MSLAKFSLTAFAGLMLLTAQPSFACTLFGAAGEGVVEGGGTILAKTRDEHPGRQFFDIVRPSDGYAYMGLFTGRKGHFNMGVNEKGLVVARSASGGIPKEKRLTYARFEKEGLRAPEWIARHYATVDEVLAHPEIFKEPVNYILADKTKVVVVEVMPGGKTTVRVTEKGTAAHTNHFIEPQSKALNEKVGQSSRIRLERICSLLSEKEKPFTTETFIAMTRDRNAGPVNSIWRTGTKPEGFQTLAAMVVKTPRAGPLEVYFTWRTRAMDPDSLQTVRRTVTLADFRKTTADFLAGK